MKPPYTITDKILHLVASISERIGEINANHYTSPQLNLEKRIVLKRFNPH